MSENKNKKPIQVKFGKYNSHPNLSSNSKISGSISSTGGVQIKSGGSIRIEGATINAKNVAIIGQDVEITNVSINADNLIISETGRKDLQSNSNSVNVTNIALDVSTSDVDDVPENRDK